MVCLDGYSAADIVYQWKSTTESSIVDRAELPEFKILGTQFNSNTVALSSGSYSRLVLQISFARAAGAQVLRAYIPAFLLVLVSFVPLALTGGSQGKTSDLLRVLFSALLLLATIAHAGCQLKGLPSVSYLTLLGAYLMMAQITAFLGLLSVSLVALVSCPKTGDRPRWAEQLDTWARLGLPALFLLYNVIYLVNIRIALSD